MKLMLILLAYILTHHVFIQSYGTHAIPSRPKVIPSQILCPPEVSSVDKNRRFPFELSHRIRNTELGRNAQAHVYVVGQGMPFNQFQPKLLTQFPEYSADLLPKSSKDHFLPVFWDEHDVVTAIPAYVRLAFPFSHRLSSSSPRRAWFGEPPFSNRINPGSVEPFRVTPPEAVV